ncbi:MAG: threonine-phosphate decarboxylase [Cyanobacteria bacterium SBLK]|nr:threonine-phosphate decarboxylase [Cyanobacteria bacterium SBLK]
MSKISSRPEHGGNLNWAAAIAGCSPEDILDFSASINPLGPPQSAIAAIQESLTSLSRYPDPQYPQLRSALARWHDLPPDWILPGNGSAELLTWACQDLAEQARVILPVPAFGDYQRGLQAFSARVYPYPLMPDVSLEGLWLSPPQTGLLLNNPHNPTGHLWTIQQNLSLLDSFDLVVLDEAFMDFPVPSEQQSLASYVQDYPNLVILRSLTKFYSLPGLRLGYAIAHPERLKRWQKRRDPWCVNALAAAAGEAVLSDREFQQQTWDWLGNARDFLFRNLAALPGLAPLPGVANFLLVKSQYSCSQLQLKLLNSNKIFIRDCLSFPELGDLYFRIAIRSPEDNQRLIGALSSAIGELNSKE